MAFLNYGSALGLAYKHDFHAWNQEMNQQEQLNLAKKAADQQKAMWLSENMKLGKTYTKFDSEALQARAKGIYAEIGKLTSRPGWETDATILAQIKSYGDTLLDNDITQRSGRVNESQQLLFKDMTNPDLVNDENARMEMQQRLEEFRNYDQYGNTSGIKDAPVSEFSYSTPKIWDVVAAFDNLAKNTGTETLPWENATHYGTRQRVKNIDQVVNTTLSGNDGKYWKRAYEKYRSQGGTTTNIRDWFKENLDQRIDTGMTSNMKPTGGGGNSMPFMPFEQELQPKLARIQELSRQNPTTPFSDYTPEAYNFIPFAATEKGGSTGILTVPNNSGLAVVSPDGKKIVSLDTFAGRAFNATATNKITYLHGKPYVEVVIPVNQDDKEFKDKILKDEAFWPWNKDWQVPDELDNVIRPSVDAKGKERKGEWMMSALVPAIIDNESKSNYDRSRMTNDKANDVQQIRQNYQAQMYQLQQLATAQAKANNFKPGTQFTMELSSGKKVNVTVNKDGTTSIQ